MRRLVLAAIVVGCGGHPGGNKCTDNDGDGYTTCDGDCNDNDPLTNPGAVEVCGDNVDNNCNMAVDEGCNGLGTFVSALAGDDTNPGTTVQPLKTIAQGMANAATIGGIQDVIVAEGSYSEKVTLAEGVSLLGGFQCDTLACTWARDVTAHASTISDVDFEGVLAGPAITPATLVEGFHIVGMDGAPTTAPGGSAVQLNGGAPELRGNDIVGGNLTGGASRSVAVWVRASNGALLDGNTLTGGTSVAGSVGLVFDNPGQATQTTTLATVTGNTIRGGRGGTSTGVTAFNTLDGTLLANNDISVGVGGQVDGIVVGSHMTIDANRINVGLAASSACTNTTGWCTGIRSLSSTTTITNNLVFGPGGTRSAAVALGEFEVAAGAVVLNSNTLVGGGAVPVAGGSSESAALVVSIGTCTQCGFTGHVGNVRNNVLEGGSGGLRFGVLEDPAAGRTMEVSVLENNLIWFTPSSAGSKDVMYRQVSATGTISDALTIQAVNALTAINAAANITGDPMYDSTWHITASSPCIDAGTATEAPPTDIDGDARPSGAGFDVGCDEM
jgi:hypothetical protein